MARLTWGNRGSRRYNYGVDRAVIYRDTGRGNGVDGVAWPGISSIALDPAAESLGSTYFEGAKTMDFLARSEFRVSASCYDLPDYLRQCMGESQALPGFFVSQQPVRRLHLCWRSKVGTDTSSLDTYKYHFLWNATPYPTGITHDTQSDSTDPAALGVDFECSAPQSNAVDSKAPRTSYISIETKLLTAAKRKALEDKMYGTDTANPVMLSPLGLFVLVRDA